MTNAKKSFFERAVADVETALKDPTVVFGTTMKALSEHTKRRRVVWIWSGGQIRPTINSGQALSADGKTSVNAIYSDVMQIVVHIMAENEDSMVQLRNSILTAVRQVLKTASTPGSYLVPTQTEQSANVYGDASVTVLNFEWDTKVPGEIKPLVEITTFTQTDVLEPVC